MDRLWEELAKPIESEGAIHTRIGINNLSQESANPSTAYWWASHRSDVSLMVAKVGLDLRRGRYRG